MPEQMSEQIAALERYDSCLQPTPRPQSKRSKSKEKVQFDSATTCKVVQGCVTCWCARGEWVINESVVGIAFDDFYEGFLFRFAATSGISSTSQCRFRHKAVRIAEKASRSSHGESAERRFLLAQQTSVVIIHSASRLGYSDGRWRRLYSPADV